MRRSGIHKKEFRGHMLCLGFYLATLEQLLMHVTSKRKVHERYRICEYYVVEYVGQTKVYVHIKVFNVQFSYHMDLILNISEQRCPTVATLRAMDFSSQNSQAKLLST